MLDEFPLIAESFQIKSYIFVPIGSHFRPVARLHFFLIHEIFGKNHIVFNFISILLQIIATWILYLTVKRIHNQKTAIFSSLLFFIIFTYNEVIIWISVVPLIYCLIFLLLAIYFSDNPKIWKSIVFIFLASLSYEVWLVLPLYYFFKKRKKLFVFSFVLAISSFIFYKLIGIKALSYGGINTVNEIPFRVIYYLIDTFFPFFTYNSEILIFILFIIITCISIYIFFKKKQFQLSIIFYFVSAILYLLSSHIPSRFFYLTAISVAIILAKLISIKNIYKYIIYGLIIYIPIISIPINIKDHIDYNNFSQEFRKIINIGESSVKKLKSGDRVLIINRIKDSYPQKYTNNLLGRPKLLFHRKGGIGGLILLNEYVNYILIDKNLIGKKTDFRGNEQIINIGDGPIVYQYCFLVQKI